MHHSRWTLACSVLLLVAASLHATTVSKTTLSFPGTAFGQSSSALYVMVTNDQAGSVALGSAISGTNGSEFSIDVGSTTCTNTLAANASCRFAVVFTPVGSGVTASSRTATLTITDTPDAGSPHTVALSGRAVPPVYVFPLTGSFGNEPIHGESAPLRFTIANYQASAISFTLVLGGLNASDFILNSSNCVKNILPGQSCVISYVLKPSATGPRSASLTVTASPDENAPEVIQLTGSGTLLSTKLYVVNEKYVTAYSATANGNVAPLSRVTALDQPTAIARGHVGYTYVLNAAGHGTAVRRTINVYAPGSKGTVAPVGELSGPHTQIVDPVFVSLDSQENIYVIDQSTPHSLLMFKPGSIGDVTPFAVLRGSHTYCCGQAIAVAPDGEIFNAIGNGTVTVYPKFANGDVAPIRAYYPGTCNASGVPGPEKVSVAIDSQFLYLGAYNDYFDSGLVCTYPLSAGLPLWSDVAPTTVLGGSNTSMPVLSSIAKIDGLLYVASGGNILVFSAWDGNVAPDRNISAQSGYINTITVAADGKIYSTFDGTLSDGNDGFDHVLAFDSTADGNATPLRDIHNLDAGLRAPSGIALAGGKLYVGDHYYSGGYGNVHRVRVYPSASNANRTPVDTLTPDVATLFAVTSDKSGKIYLAGQTLYSEGKIEYGAPGGTLATITGSNTGLDDGDILSMAVDAAGRMLVLRIGGAFPPEVLIFSAGSSGNASPAAYISGSNTGFATLNLSGLGVNPVTGDIYVSGTTKTSPTGVVKLFAANSSGNATPKATLTGSNTGLQSPSGIAFDASGYLYVLDSGTNSIAVFAPGSTGNVSPVRVIRGSKTGLSLPNAIVIGP